MHPSQLEIKDFTYELPEDRIAQRPLQQRDASRLLIYRDMNIEEDTYRRIAAHVPENALMIFNQTKVIHARLLFKKSTGGIIEVFCLEPDDSYPDITTAMLRKGSVHWKCMVGGASKWKPGMVLEKKMDSGTLYAEIIERGATDFLILLRWDDNTLSFAEVLQKAGAVPLPPYMNREAEEDDLQRYQTIFAKQEGSVAAPTAGLHFTDAVLTDLKAKNITTTSITLHVGAGTFQPVKSETIKGHEMHAEWIEVPLEIIETLLLHINKNIIAVGTTPLRTLESLYWIGVKLLSGMLPDFSHIAVTQWEPYDLPDNNVSAESALNALRDWMLQHQLHKLVTKTQILIAPGYRFRIINALVTNFHQPNSTLLLLVAALVGDDWKRVYEHALKNNYRFLSYGDGCFLWTN